MTRRVAHVSCLGQRRAGGRPMLRHSLPAAEHSPIALADRVYRPSRRPDAAGPCGHKRRQQRSVQHRQLSGDSCVVCCREPGPDPGQARDNSVRCEQRQSWQLACLVIMAVILHACLAWQQLSCSRHPAELFLVHLPSCIKQDVTAQHAAYALANACACAEFVDT